MFKYVPTIPTTRLNLVEATLRWRHITAACCSADSLSRSGLVPRVECRVMVPALEVHIGNLDKVTEMTMDKDFGCS
jgi:hypothetical protein